MVKRQHWWTKTALAVGLAWGLSGCGADDDRGRPRPVLPVVGGALPDAGGPLDAGRVEGFVTYEGSPGTLYLALYTADSFSVPPTRLPDVLKEGTLVGSYSPYVIAGVPEGDYYLVAFIALGGDHQTPEVGDPVYYSPSPLTVTLDAPAQHNFTLAEPTP